MRPALQERVSLTGAVQLEEERLVVAPNRVGDGGLQQPPVVSLGGCAGAREAGDEPRDLLGTQKPTTQVLISVAVNVCGVPNVVGNAIDVVSAR